MSCNNACFYIKRTGTRIQKYLCIKKKDKVDMAAYFRQVLEEAEVDAFADK